MDKESECLSYYDKLKEFVLKLEESEQRVTNLDDLNSSLEDEISRLQATFKNDNNIKCESKEIVRKNLRY